MKTLIKFCIYITWPLSLVIFSCQNDVDLEIPQPPPEITVDGWIENNGFPHVFLTSSAYYFSDIDSASLRELVLTRAKVMVSDGNTEEILTLVLNRDYFPPYLYRGNFLRGEAGKTYKLTVEYAGKTVKSFTTIPEPVNLTNVWFERMADSDSAGVIKAEFNDKGDEKNYYKTFTKILGVNTRFVPTLISNYDDKLFNGEKIVLTLYRGQDTYLRPTSEIYFKTGDTIQLKLCTIDQESFQFWLSYQDEVINGGNPFASSHRKILSNIDGGLGIWCGYGVSNYLVIARD